MISLVNLKSFMKSKTFHNYLIINILIFSFFFLILSVKNFCNYKLKKVINDDSNKVINISNFENYNSLIEFLNKYQNKITNIEYHINLNNLIINNNDYIVFEDCFNEDSYSIKVNDKLNIKDLKIEDLTITNIIKDENISENIIYINQKISEYIYKYFPENRLYMSFSVKDYYDITEILNYLQANKIDSNLNIDSTETFSTYIKFSNILDIFFKIFILAIILITFVINFHVINEQKKCIKIYKVIGYKLSNILYIYSLTFLILLLSNFIISSLLFLIICLLLLIVKINFFTDFINNGLFILLINILINCLTNIIGLIFINRKEI